MTLATSLRATASKLMAKFGGTAIDETECRAFTGSGAQEAKLVTSWMVELDDGDEISLMIANHSNTTDIVLKRGRIVASEVFA